jgi:DNA-binding PadR family transcriptional regulator
MFGTGHDYKGCKISPMQTVILLLLLDRPMYGYEVLKELRDRFEGAWTPQTGSIYPSIKRMVEHGLVSSEQREGTDYYSITEEGRKWVLEMLHHSPRDIRLLIRFLQIMDRAAADVHAEGAERPLGPFSEAFEGENPDVSRRTRRLRAARQKIAEHLAYIDKELAELENGNNKEEQQ